MKFLLAGLFALAGTLCTRLLQTVYDDTYANTECGLQVVQTANPKGYADHPVWRSMRPSNCEDIDRYVARQSTNHFQKTLGTWSTYVGTTIGVITLLHSVFTFGTRHLPRTIVVTMIAATIILGTTHFENDILHMNGGMLHHANGPAGLSGAEGNSLADGLVQNVNLNRVAFSLALLTTPSPVPKGALFAAVQLGIDFAVRRTNQTHVFGHSQTNETLREWGDTALPWTQKRRAYSHCLVHHPNGYDMVGDPILDTLWFNPLMDVYGWLHRNIAKGRVDSWAHVLLRDGFHTVIRAGAMWMLCQVAAYRVNSPNKV